MNRPAAVAGPLERFIPRYDVRERFETTIRAPAQVVMEPAAAFDMRAPVLVRSIFWMREKIMGGSATPRRKQGLRDEARALCWGILAEEPGRFVVFGARCQPWRARVEFTAIEPADFEAYAEPNQVKIVWTLEATGLGSGVTRFAQETRAVATDAGARAEFLQYWRWARFGIVSIRLLLLPAIRRAAERRWVTQRGCG
jgi:hypothetical protein